MGVSVVADFKAMGLYNNVERIAADLAAVGIGPGDPLDVDDLTPFDQYHYEGVDAVASAAHELGLGPDDDVLDIGSGLGGPARFLADHFGCRVTALEIQRDLHRTGRSLTDRCGLADKVRHVEGDVLAGAALGPHTAIVSMLCFLHIADREALFGRCAEALNNGGSILIDDYFARGSLTQADKDALATEVQCPYLPSKSKYEDDLRSAGFKMAEVTDRTVADLFAAGRLGGARFRATLTPRS